MRVNKTALLALFLSALCAPLYAEIYSDDGRADEEKMAQELKKYHFETVTTKEGLKFNIPPDMPIEKKDGLVQPVEFNQYLYVKFKSIEERITALEKSLDDLDKKLDVQFKETKELILKTQKPS